jgi:hypothetical protein
MDALDLLTYADLGILLVYVAPSETKNMAPPQAVQ